MSDSVGEGLLRSATEQIYFMFLVPLSSVGGWQVATREGKIMVTTNTDHFGSSMPQIIAGKHFLALGQHVVLEDLLLNI